MKALALPPYRLLRGEGSLLALDLATKAVLDLSAPVHAFLQATLRDGDEGARRIVSRTHSPAEAADAEREVRRLREAGHLCGPVQTRDEGDWERLVAGYVRWPTKGAEIFLAEDCNLRCRYCYAGANGALRGRRLALPVARDAVRFVFRRSAGLRHVNFVMFGGEPLLNFPLLQFVVGYARALGREFGKRPRFHVTTNGTLISREVARFLKHHGFTVTLSWDGPPAVHDAMRPTARGGPSSARVAQGLRRLREVGLEPGVRATVTPACLDLGAVAAYFGEAGLHDVHLTRAEGRVGCRATHDVDRAHWPAVHRALDAAARRVVARAAAGEEPIYNPFAEDLRVLSRGGHAPLPCGATRAVTSISVTGELYPCHRFVGMRNWVIGDVRTGVVRRRHADVLRGYFALRAQCERCWAVDLCELRCPWYFAQDDGSVRPPEDWRCRIARENLARVVRLYAELRRTCPDYLARIVGPGADRAKAVPRAS
jgi:uncharacterized protein